MSDDKKPTSPSAKCGDSPASSATMPCMEEKKYKVTDLTLSLDVPDDKLMMNDPDQEIEVKAIMSYTITKNPEDLDALPEHIHFTFADPGSDNTSKVDSYEYSGGNFLAKKGDASAKYWKAHAECSASSDDGFKTKSKVETKTLEADKKEIAKVYFKPSGVGGNDYKITAKVYKPDETTEIATDDSNTLVVWRKVSLQAYEMDGQTHVSTHGTTAKMNGYYVNDTYVEYELGTVTSIAADKSVKYIGLWDHGSLAMVSWATHVTKIGTETPTADETTKANAAVDSPDRITARNDIQTKANAWRDRINTQYTSGLNKWATDAGVPAKSLVAIEFEHPKYSASAPNADSVTSEWSTFPWLRINVEGTNIHPDRRWINGQGLAYGNRAYITAGMSAARTEVVIAHEAGHETKNQFKRNRFGAGDHTSTAGLMDPTGSQNSFTVGEKKKLRGVE